MKKTVSILCAGALSFTLFACGGQATTTTQEETATEETAKDEETTDEEATDEKEATDEEATDETEEKEEKEAKEEKKSNKSLVNTYMETLDAEKGVHFNYQKTTEYMDMVSEVDTHIKGKNGYSASLTQVSGMEGDDAALILDGELYSLHDDHTATHTMSAGSLVTNNLLAWDDLYSEMLTRSRAKDYTVEEREVDGKTYTVEMYPAPSEYVAAAEFFFDEDGNLARIHVDALESGNSLGEENYTVHSIDDKVDESLFTLDGYTVEEW